MKGPSRRTSSALKISITSPSHDWGQFQCQLSFVRFLCVFDKFCTFNMKVFRISSDKFLVVFQPWICCSDLNFLFFRSESEQEPESRRRLCRLRQRQRPRWRRRGRWWWRRWRWESGRWRNRLWVRRSQPERGSGPQHGPGPVPPGWGRGH